MAQISFSISDERLDKINKVIPTWNLYNPLSQVDTADEFAKKCLLELLPTYIDKYKSDKKEIILNKIEKLDDTSWDMVINQIDAIAAPAPIDAPIEAPIEQPLPDVAP